MRLIQISDTHLPSTTGQDLFGCYPHRTLEQIVSAVSALQPRADAILVSGDIAENGLELEYQLFVQQLEPLKIPVYLLPGNHDDAEMMQQMLCDRQFIHHSSAIVDGWSLLLVNSQVVGCSHGHVSRARLDALDAQLKAASDRPALVALHHSPASRCVDSGCQLDNHKELLELLQSHQNVKLLLAGHTHQADERYYNGLCIYTAPSTFAQVAHPGDLALLNAEDFFASHQIDSSRVGFRVFDLASDGSYAQQLHWLAAS